MSLVFPDQQPIARIVGRRKQAPLGAPPSAAVRAALDTLANRLTRAPKGVFRYATHEDMQRDRERWQVQAVVDTQRSRALWQYINHELDGIRLKVLSLEGLLEELGRR